MTDLIGLLLWLVCGMVLSEAQTFGFSETVRKMIERERRALEKAGLNVEEILTSLRSLHEATLAAGETQEASKRSAKAATETFVAMKKQLYVAASGYLDMAIAAVGKDSDAAKNLRRYRSQIYRPSPDEPTVEPLPEPTPSEQ